MRSRCTVLLTLLLILPGCAEPGGSEGDPLDGVWRVTHVRYVMADGTVETPTPQESLFLFDSGFYSMGFAVGESPSPPFETGFAPTDEERAARAGTLTINGGTYEVAGPTLLLRPQFAFMPEFVGGYAEIDYRIADDTLRLIWRRSVSNTDEGSPWTVAGHVEELTLIRVR